MDPKDKDRITSHLTDLVEATDLNSRLEQKLMEKNVFTENMIKEIKSSTDSRTLQNLYMRVQTRGPEAFRNLVSSLLESGNIKAARVLDPQISLCTGDGNTLRKQRASKVWNEPNYEDAAQNAYAPYIPPPVNADSKTPLTVKVKESSVYHKTSSLHQLYPMQSKPRGNVLIIDNEEFTNGNTTRTGTQVDANNLDILFEQLGFKVKLRRNLNFADMKKEIHNFSQLRDHFNADMAVLCLLSHGRKDHIAPSHGHEEIQTEWVLSQFNNSKCPALKGKPKFFIFQACRGDELDYGYRPPVTTHTDGRQSVDANRAPPPPARPNQTEHSNSSFKDPTWEDMLIAYSTLPNYVANRDIYRGTWYIEALTQVFMDRACELEIREMLDEVSKRLKFYESEGGTKQSASYEVIHFYKKLYFNPGLYKDESDRPKSLSSPI